MHPEYKRLASRNTASALPPPPLPSRLAFYFGPTLVSIRFVFSRIILFFIFPCILLCLLRPSLTNLAFAITWPSSFLPSAHFIFLLARLPPTLVSPPIRSFSSLRPSSPAPAPSPTRIRHFSSIVCEASNRAYDDARSYSWPQPFPFGIITIPQPWEFCIQRTSARLF